MPGPVGPAPETATGCAKPGSIGSAPLRRLTNTEYNNTVRDLLGFDMRPADAFLRGGQIGGLTNNVAQLGLSGAIVEGYFSAADRLAAKASEDLPKLLGCDPAGAAEQTCVKGFIESFGQRAFRRPLSAEERGTFETAYAAIRKSDDVRGGVRGVVEAMLVSPQFLFRSEGGAANGGVETLDAFSVASRLSYLLWGSMPDATLFEAARADSLKTTEQLTAQADRMLKDPRATEAMRHVLSEWIDADAIADLKKDEKAFPNFAKQRGSMKKELERFIDWVLTEKEGSLEALMTSNVGFVDEEMAKLYGVSGVTGTDLKQVDLPANRRSGVLTRAGFIASVSSEKETNLVHRGMTLRERMFCQVVQPPPPNVAVLPPPDPKQTTRQRFDKHKSDPTCAGCHVLMDPLGLAFETYDATGAWRDKEGDNVIDDSGEITGTTKDEAFRGAVGLGKALAANPTHQECVTEVFFRNAFGRSVEAADKCSVDALHKQFVAGGLKTKDLLRAIVVSDAFRFRPVSN